MGTPQLNGNTQCLTLVKIVKLDLNQENDSNNAVEFSPAYITTINTCSTAESGVVSQGTQFQLLDTKSEVIAEFTPDYSVDYCKISKDKYAVQINDYTYTLQFRTHIDLFEFTASLARAKKGNHISVFSNRTDEASATQYFQFYGYLSQQQNMLQDYIRTSTYQKAVLVNTGDFTDKIILDVGAGSGILSFFSVQAGAKKVYAVEASSMAQHAQSLVNANNLSDKIIVIPGKIEEIELPEKVDVIISEPMGYMLYNERMLETYLHAKKWLKPGGKMYPSKGDLHIAPFTDDALFMEQTNKASFWVQSCFHGVDLSSLRDVAMREYFRQPIVDTFDIRICLAKSVKHSLDFLTADEQELHKIDIPLEFYILESGTVHGLAFWFDVAFQGSNQTLWLSTSPTEALTHWYQVRCLLEKPIFVKVGQVLTGTVCLQANVRQSYDVLMTLMIDGLPHTSSSNNLDLKNPYFRYTGQPPQPPPGVNTISPSESYWANIDLQSTSALVNGIPLNGYATDIAMDISPSPVAVGNNGNLISLVTVPQPNIHPGSISSTGRQRVSTATSAAAAQLIGGGISPTMYQNQNQQLLLGAASATASAGSSVAAPMVNFPVNNALMIGDYVAPNAGNGSLLNISYH
ncbi:probable histone-arginine methyltransferase CARMER [Adelges cooleyi]|uniref:probable histone-arginine methyltransferase CARMER n=1 Tax=Adelges cooleyi TaxID=133065 RepID=UPI00217FA2AB|nr:probable histone-arginine methyltransferase CARMER [Adelges cooleyi]XP_050421078.1 probable histone-arginine methyltransferase CARMER [Adelges cooleyi]XP_050421079.1 probable histone-arginine methyltransferase CARMER [Adelges cooleyi]XP_050421080.1 probable histone-arginine methyltransferase CARMER [Adelges cooleyi]